MERIEHPALQDRRGARAAAHVEPVPLTSEADLVNPMYTVGEVMRAGEVACDEDEPAVCAAARLRESGWPCVPVTRRRHVVGLVSADAVAAAVAARGGDVTRCRVEDLMTPATCVSAEAPLSEALRLMGERGTSSLPVTGSSGRPVGLVSFFDVVPHLTDRGVRKVLAGIASRRAPRPA